MAAFWPPPKLGVVFSGHLARSFNSSTDRSKYYSLYTPPFVPELFRIQAKRSWNSEVKEKGMVKEEPRSQRNESSEILNQNWIRIESLVSAVFLFWRKFLRISNQRVRNIGDRRGGRRTCPPVLTRQVYNLFQEPVEQFLVFFHGLKKGT